MSHELSSAQLPPDQEPAEQEEDNDPGGGDGQSKPYTLRLVDAPAPQHDVPHALDCLGVRQHPGEHPHPLLGHPLQRPDDATEQQVRKAGSNAQLHSVHARVAHRREKESEGHARQS